MRRDSLPVRMLRRSLSIRYRLPLLISGLLLVLGIAFAWAAYLEVRRAALTAARERLGQVTRQLADLLATSGRQMTVQGRALGRRPPVLAYLRASAPPATVRAAALAAMDSANRAVESVVGIDLWSAEGTVRLKTEGTAASLEPETARHLFSAMGSDSGIVGPYRVIGDSVYYATAARVTEQGEVAGYVIQHRRITGSAEGARQLRELIGAGAAVLIGNQQGDVWTDLARLAPPPPVSIARTGDSLLQYQRSGGSSWLASAAPVPGTDWLVVMEFPRDPVLQGARRVAQHLAVVTLMLLVLGGAGAWALSRRLTRPLSELVAASNAIAGGEYRRRVTVPYGDELGELGDAFNIMAAKVEDAQQRLGEQVAQRTAQLRTTEEQFQSLAATANDAVITANADGRITYVNPGAERTFGYSAEEMVGQPLTLLMPERFHEPHRRGLARYLAGGEARVVGRTVELAGRRKDRSEFPVELSLATWGRGDTRSFGAIIRDITARKEAEAAIQRHATELEAANKELEAFSYSVSHDLRAPLRSIDGFSLALLEDYGVKLDKTAQEHLGRVRSASQRMATLIDDLLKLAQVTRTELRPQRLDLSEMVQQIVEELRRHDGGRRVEVVIAPQVHAYGDRQLVRQVLENLLGNAWKFTAKRSGARIEFGVALREGEPAYFVRDNGAGFDPKYVDKLFTPFQRLHAASEFEGTGIGLATVQRVIQRHGGRVWADSDSNQGAVFHFTLPSLGAPVT